MKQKITWSFALIALILMSFSLKKMANPFIGKWQLVSKIEVKYENDQLQERFEKNYKPAKKVYEFSTSNKLTIIEDYGKSKEKKSYWVEGNVVYIGKEKTENTKFNYTFNPDQTVTLKRTKTKVKNNITYVENEELVLSRIIEKEPIK